MESGAGNKLFQTCHVHDAGETRRWESSKGHWKFGSESGERRQQLGNQLPGSRSR